MRKRRVIALLVAIPIVVATPLAFGALHTVNDFSHGIVSTPGYNCNATHHYCRAWVHDVDGTGNNANLGAGMYHWTGSSWNPQPGAPSTCVNCTKIWHDGQSGSMPCRKYAWTRGADPTSNLDWHGTNTQACGYNHVGW